MTDRAWVVEHYRGAASAFHERPWPDPLRRTVWCFEVDAPSVVLGSAQSLDVVDAERARRAGVAVARRRSGGGAVWLAPGAVTWVDLLVPAADPWWDHDVSRAAHWVGERWAEVLADLGHDGVSVHRRGLVRSPWSDLVCFAGLGPGEVSWAGRKVVGISQRRTRVGARFQCAVLHHWDPGPLLDVLALSDPERNRARADLVDVAAAAAARPATALAAFLQRLPSAG